MDPKLLIIALFLVTAIWTAPAHAADAGDTVGSNAEIETVAQATAARALDHRLLAARLAEQDPRYRRGRALVRVGTVATVTAVAAAYTGSQLTDWLDGPEWNLGTILGYSGVALYCVGPVLSTVGALQSAGAIRRRGVHVNRQFGFLAVTLLGVTAALSPVIVHVYGDAEQSLGVLLIGGYASALPAVAAVASLAQSWNNQRALPGIEGLAVVPTWNGQTGGMAIRASF